MQRFDPEINAFTGGELSPRMAGRTDIRDYFRGCKDLENCVVYTHGGASKRMGTKYIATASNSTRPVRVIPFRYSTEQAYVLEFGHQYMRVYKDGGIITVSGSAYSIATPYDGYDVPYLDYTQSADVMYITHADYPVYKLTRTGHSAWTLTEVTFTNGPFLPENTTATTITPTATTGSVGLTASSSIFANGHVGAYFSLGDSVTVTGSISAENTWTSNLYVENAGETLIAAAESLNWGSTVVYIRKTYDNGSTWVDVGYLSDNSSTEIAENNGDVYYHIGVKTGDYDTGPISVSLTLLNQSGYVEITSVASATSASGTVINTLPSTSATTKWREGAWSTYRGFPYTVCFFEQRLVFGGNDYRPQTLWASKVDDYENFDEGTALDDDAWIYSLVSQDVNSIRWLVPADVLRIGTVGGEWKFGFTDQATTPTNVDTKLHSTIGSAQVKPLLINGNVIFVQEGGRKIRAMAWDDNTKQYIAPEISARAEHLFNMTYGITEMVYTLNPDPIIWMIRYNDGSMIGCTFDSNERVVAYHEHITSGYFESMATIPGDDRDELWVVVARDVDGSTVRMIEQFATPNWNRSDQSTAIFLDSALTYSGAGNTTFSGLDHLEGLEVVPITKGGVHPAVTVSGGVIELEYSTIYCHAGLAYTATLETMDLNYPINGSTVGKKKSVHNVNIYFQDTNYAQVQGVENDTVKFRSTVDYMDTAIPLFTGTHNLSFPQGYANEVSIKVVSDKPLPFTVLSIAPIMSAGQF